MGFLKYIFKRKSTSDSAKKEVKRSADEELRGSIASGATAISIGSDACSEDKLPQKRIKVCKKWLENFNSGNLEAIQELLTADFKAVFGDVELTWKDTLEGAPKAFAAFPDFQLKCTEMEALEDGSIRFRVVASGTHTGAPYSFGPFDPIEATGKYVENDPEQSIMFFSGEKICKQVVKPMGTMTGFSGLYTQLGGFPLL